MNKYTKTLPLTNIVPSKYNFVRELIQRNLSLIKFDVVYKL